MNYKEHYKESPIVSTMGVPVWTVFRQTQLGRAEIGEFRTPDSARVEMERLNKLYPEYSHYIQREEMPDLLPKKTAKKTDTKKGY